MKPVEIEFLMRDNLTAGLDKSKMSVEQLLGAARRASLIINTKTQIGLITKGGADWGPYVQAILGVLLVILAVVLAVEGISTLSKQAKAKAAK